MEQDLAKQCIDVKLIQEFKKADDAYVVLESKQQCKICPCVGLDLQTGKVMYKWDDEINLSFQIITDSEAISVNSRCFPVTNKGTNALLGWINNTKSFLDKVKDLIFARHE